MSHIGQPDDTAITTLVQLYTEASTAVFGGYEPTDDQLGELAGRRILDYMRERLSLPKIEAADMIASIHEFLAHTLIARLADRIERDGKRTDNLCLVGGCALNIKWNRRIRVSGVASRMWIPPFPNDAGSALGTACCQLMQTPGVAYLEWGAYSGPDLRSSDVPDNWVKRPCFTPGTRRLAAY